MKESIASLRYPPEIMNDESTCTDVVCKLVGVIEVVDGVGGEYADIVYIEGDVVRRYWKRGNGSIHSSWRLGDPSWMLKRVVYNKYGF